MYQLSLVFFQIHIKTLSSLLKQDVHCTRKPLRSTAVRTHSSIQNKLGAVLTFRFPHYNICIHIWCQRCFIGDSGTPWPSTSCFKLSLQRPPISELCSLQEFYWYSGQIDLNFRGSLRRLNILPHRISTCCPPSEPEKPDVSNIPLSEALKNSKVGVINTSTCLWASGDTLSLHSTQQTTKAYITTVVACSRHLLVVHTGLP